MANSSNSATATDRRAQPVGGTALHGNIEAIGIPDLLRIAVAKGNTGRLLVFNDQTDAELYYDQGRLVGVMSSAENGLAQLKVVFAMTEGEFEFARGLEIPRDQHDPALHDAMMQAIKEHYQQRVRSRQDSGAAPAAQNKMSGVHRVSSPSVTVSPIVSVEQPSAPTHSFSEASAASNDASVGATVSEALLKGETGRATADLTGRTTAKLGSIATQEVALAALISKQAQTIATLIGMRGLERFELRGANDQALLCRANKDKLQVSHITPEADVEAIWSQLGL
ncbi:MAG: DUF4388 domain-containing protein [Polyangiaceae bacterium]